MPPNPYFGERWDAPATDTAEQVGTPIGQDCLDCGEPIMAGDQGFIYPCFSADGGAEVLPIHRECSLLAVVGHTFGICRCTEYGQTGNRRQGALALWEIFQLDRRWREEGVGGGGRGE